MSQKFLESFKRIVMFIIKKIKAGSLGTIAKQLDSKYKVERCQV